MASSDSDIIIFESSSWISSDGGIRLLLFVLMCLMISGVRLLGPVLSMSFIPFETAHLGSFNISSDSHSLSSFSEHISSSVLKFELSLELVLSMIFLLEAPPMGNVAFLFLALFFLELTGDCAGAGAGATGVSDADAVKGARAGAGAGAGAGTSGVELFLVNVVVDVVVVVVDVLDAGLLVGFSFFIGCFGIVLELDPISFLFVL